MGRKNHQGLIFIALFALLPACVKDKPPGVTVTVPNSSDNVYVVCEGNFGSGDASLYDYLPAKDSVYGDLYQSVNGKSLGDVFQSMVRAGNYFFLAVNNSNKVVVLNSSNLTQVAVLSIPQPRYILPVSNTKAYVSTLYSNNVYIINTQTLQVTGTISLPTKSQEQMCLYNGNAIVSSWDTTANQIYEIDGNTDKIIQTFQIPAYAPEQVLLDKDQMLWVFSAGNNTLTKTGAWTRLDPSTGEILANYFLPDSAYPLCGAFNNTGDTLYYIIDNYSGGTSNNGVYRMSIYDNSLPSQPFIPAQENQYYYALGIDKINGSIYVADPVGFTQQGVVTIYNAAGAKLNRFSVGVGPGGFYFDE